MCRGVVQVFALDHAALARRARAGQLQLRLHPPVAHPRGGALELPAQQSGSRAGRRPEVVSSSR